MATQTRKGFYAVVESGSWIGSCPTDHQHWEERRNCGHAHKTVKAAERCGKKHYNARTNKLTGSWEANADWHGYRVHNENGERVP